LMSIWSSRITESAAFWGMLSGLAFNIVPKFFEFIGMIQFPSYLNPVLIGGAVSLIVTIAISYRTTVSTEESSYLRKLHVTPADEIDVRKTRTSLWAPAILVLNGLIMPYLLITYYVRPYQAARGELLPDGSLNWLAGESILVLSWMLVYVSLGLFSIKIIRNAYAPPR
ncbi:MAG: sodium:solute symporter family protein, partial [Woeseia sp.]|nr:sodium:solute symporter family protein [Woeseia sp.]